MHYDGKMENFAEQILTSLGKKTIVNDGVV